MKRLPKHLAMALPTRRGASLVQLVLTITLGGLVLTMGIGMMHLMLRTDKTLADSLWRSHTVSRLSQTFREDVHAARNVELKQPENEQNANQPAAPDLILILAPNHFVSYSIQDHALHRSEYQGEKKVRAERFRFSPGTRIAFEVNEAAPVAVVIRSENPQSVKRRSASKVPLRELRIAAVPGRDHRFAAQESNQDAD